MTVEVNPSIPGQRPRYLYFGFIASLAVNLLFVGLFLTAAWHLHQEEHDRPPASGLLGFVNQLPADRQEPVRQKILAAREAMKDLQASLRQRWLDVNALLTQEPFDKAKFQSGLQELKDYEARYRAGIYNMVADTAGLLTPDERRALQKWRAERRARFLSPHDDREKPDDKDNKALTD